MTWQLAYLMPNITLNQSIETDYLALVSFKDERLQLLMANNKDAENLVNSFIDSNGRQIEPSVLLINSDAPDSLWSDEAIINFRNILAVSVIIYGWANVSEFSGGSSIPLYSDFFDFYPVTIGKNGGLITQTPAVMSYSSSSASFVGVRDISLPTLLKVNFYPDELLYKSLISIWERRFIHKQKNDKFTRVLLRSLEMAYHALSLPSRNHSTLYDFGVSLSMWVSALEILGHIEIDQVKQETIINYLGRYMWINPKLNQRRYSVRISKKKIIRVNIIQKITKNVYDSRNAFLHGNEVSNKFLFTFHNKKKPSLSRIAPIIYRTALYIYLGNKIKRKKFDFGSYMTDSSYESCLEQLLDNRLPEGFGDRI